MLKEIKITISFLLVALILLNSVNVFASSINQKNQMRSGESVQETIQRFETMSIQELNKYIDDVKVQTESNEIRERRALPIDLKTAWIAAAVIADKAGYPLSAKLVIHSANNVDYYEKNGQFSRAIIETNVYKDWVKDQNREAFIAFETSDDPDLYYSLHQVNIILKNSASSGTVYIEDRFNFELWNYESLFASIVNNWAWLCQNIHVLNDIDVKIIFDV